MVPIESPLVVSYLTSILSNVVSRTYSRYLIPNSCDLELEWFKVIQGQRSWCQSIAPGWFPIRLPLTPSSYLSPFANYLTVILMTLNYEGSRSSKVKGNGPNRKPIGVLSYLTFCEFNIISLTVFEIFDIKDIFP